MVQFLFGLRECRYKAARQWLRKCTEVARLVALVEVRICLGCKHDQKGLGLQLGLVGFKSRG